MTDGRRRLVWCDVVIEAVDGTPIEIVECKEHADYLPPESLTGFLDDVAVFHSSLALRDVAMRLVSTARVLTNGTNVADPAQRRRVLRKLDPEHAELASSERVHFDFDVAAKEALTALTVFELTGHVDDPKDLYGRLYGRMMAQMAKRHGDEGDRFIRWIRDLHLELFRDVRDAAFAETLERGADGDAMDVAEVRSILSPGRPAAMTVAAEKVYAALRRDLFGEAAVTLEQIFIESKATIETPAASRTLLRTGSALAILFDWLSDLRSGRVRRAPLLLLGGFGFGKSSLLTEFSARLLGTEIVPLLVPLRDLITTGTRPFGEVVEEYVRREWNVRLATSHDSIRYCLLCDGFDELNIYYSRSDQRNWVEQCYRELAGLARVTGAAVIVSSRPILLMDADRDSTMISSARVHLHDFDDGNIRTWCAKYAAAAGLSRRFSWDFLTRRNLDTVAHMPLVLYMIARIFETAPDLLRRKEYNRADVYRVFVDWTERGGYARDAAKHRLPENYRHILQDIGWHLFQSHDGLLLEEELIDKLHTTWGEAARDGVRIDRNLLVAHMLQPVGGKKTRLVEFTHQSFRDYLVAERIWRELEHVRRGESLDAAVWLSLSGNTPSSATMRFLSDFIDRIERDEARALYSGLAQADNVHAYWSRWLAPVWKELGNDRSAEILERVKAKVDTTLPRACTMATLAFLLRMRAYRRLVALRATAALAPPEAGNLMQLQHIEYSLGNTGVALAGRSLLLDSLSGLRLQPGADLEGFIAGVAAWNDVVVPGVEFTRSVFPQTMFYRCDFTRCKFYAATLTPRSTLDVRFNGASFVNAHLSFDSAEVDGHVRIDFTGADFVGARIDMLRVAHSIFGGNRWHDAWVGSGDHRLLNCTLDHTAAEFFQRAGVNLVGCKIVSS